MLQILSNFDPITYLSIDVTSLSQDEKGRLQISLRDRIGQYILLKFSNQLTNDQFNSLGDIQNGDELIKRLLVLIPNMEESMNQELENFKVEYQMNKGDKGNA